MENIKINYAKRAKKIDVNKLKTKMWEIISEPQEKEMNGPDDTDTDTQVLGVIYCAV